MLPKEYTIVNETGEGYGKVEILSIDDITNTITIRLNRKESDPETWSVYDWINWSYFMGLKLDWCFPFLNIDNTVRITQALEDYRNLCGGSVLKKMQLMNAESLTTDLSMLVRRLTYYGRDKPINDELIEQAKNFLKRNNLLPSILRDSDSLANE